MDTDDLTEMADRTIILANEATDVLKCELGVLCGRFETEDEFLAGVLEYLAKLAGAPEEYLDYWGLRDDAGVSAFAGKLDAVRRHPQAAVRIKGTERRRLACVGGCAAMTGWKPILPKEPS